VMDVNMRQALRERGLKVGTGFLEFDTPGVGQIAKAAGADYAFVDMEHSGFGIETIKRVLRYFQSADLPTVVRPPTKATHHIGQVLDAGANAVLVPMIETADEARDAVQACRYYPDGRRGAALGIAHDRYRGGSMAETFAAANQNVGAIMLIESVKGVENIADIAATDGVDGLWVGAFDLSCSLKRPGDFGSREFRDAAASVITAARKHGLNSGRLVGSPEEGARLFNEGVDWISYSADVYLLRNALKSGFDQIRALSRPRDATQ